MSILLSNISAMEFWRYAAHVNRLPPASARRILDAPLEKPRCQEFASLEDRGFSFLSSPIHVLVHDKASRSHRSAVRSHVTSCDLLCRSVVRLAEGLYVATPAACFFDLATSLSFPHAIETGFELSGRYARSVGEFDELAKRAPLVSVAALERFLQRMEGVRGTAKARRVLRFVRDGSRSPMETVTVVLLCLPARLGGYGLPYPVINAVIPVSQKDRPFVKKSYYECDLYWPEAKFAIEYDSNLHHTGATRIAEDASRRVDLAYLGIEVATLTQQQTYDLREMDRIARLLAKRLGRRLREERLDPSGVQGALRAHLLSSDA